MPWGNSAGPYASGSAENLKRLFLLQQKFLKTSNPNSNDEIIMIARFFAAVPHMVDGLEKYYDFGKNPKP